jgi:hypothetical protein
MSGKNRKVYVHGEPWNAETDEPIVAGERASFRDEMLCYRYRDCSEGHDREGQAKKG